MSLTDPPTMPGPGVTDPILLLADQGFSAQIELHSWLLLGAPAAVCRAPSQGPWPGTVRGFQRAVHAIAEWHLASGERREWRFFSKPDEDLNVGHKFPVKLGGNQWDATVVHTEPATQVTIMFIIQSGATRRRDFWRLGQIDFYGKPGDHGMVDVYHLPAPAEATP